MRPVDDAGFSLLAERIAGQTGLDVGAYKERCLRRRIAVRMRACGVTSYQDYVGLIDQRPGELEALLDALTINVTRFFRNPETWAWVGAEALPRLLLAREGRLRAWSAGCASGEEPYTIVMLVAEVRGRLNHPDWLPRLHVDATDLDRGSLDTASAAEYPPAAFSEADPAVIARWTDPAEHGRRRVQAPLRAVVHLRRLDLLRESAPQSAYDLIFCRNVIIYFDRADRNRLISRLADQLAPGGYLFLGHAESLLDGNTPLGIAHLGRELVYRKPT